MSLIFLTNKRVSQTTRGVKANWYQYGLHIFLMLAMTASSDIFYLSDSAKSAVHYQLATYIIESLMSCLICYVVWAQASSTQFNFYDFTIVQESDGRQRLICNRRSSTITATSDFTSSCSSSINIVIEEEQNEDQDLRLLKHVSSFSARANCDRIMAQFLDATELISSQIESND